MNLAILLSLLSTFQGDPDARVEEARRLLAEAGFPDGKGFPRLEVLYSTDDLAKAVAAKIQSDWKENLGIQVELRNLEWKTYLETITKTEYDIAARGWIGDYYDPNTFLDLFTSYSGNNNTNWSDPEYDRKIRDAAREADPAKRMKIFEAAERILLEEAPITPLFFYVSQNMYRENVRGVYPNIQDLHPLREVYVEGKDELVINNNAEPRTLDPAIMTGVLEFRVADALFEGLTAYDPKTGEPVPGVADLPEVSADGLTYTYRLRECYWSDGKPVTAHDFVYAWNRVLDPDTANDYAYILYYIKNAEKRKDPSKNGGKVLDPSEVGVRAEGDRTLIVTLEHPTPFFRHLTAFMTYYPVRKDVVEAHGDRWTRPEAIVGNGPYVLKEWKVKEFLLLEKNPRYWRAAAVRQPRIRFLPIEDRMTAFNMYEKGQIDWLTRVPTQIIDELRRRRDYRASTYFGTSYYSFNVKRPPLGDRRVRRALGLAIDREMICEMITKAGQEPAYHFVPPGIPGYTSPRFWSE